METDRGTQGWVNQAMAFGRDATALEEEIGSAVVFLVHNCKTDVARRGFVSLVYADLKRRAEEISTQANSTYRESPIAADLTHRLTRTFSQLEQAAKPYI